MSFHVSPMCICVLKVKKRCSREIDIEIRTIFDIEHKHIYIFYENDEKDIQWPVRCYRKRH